jgi:hypothetical protein
MLSIDISTRANPGCILRIDECDRALVDGIRWTPDRRAGGLIYVHRKEPGNIKRYLHREIMQPPSGLVVDHIDRNGLNNCRANLRIVTERENCWNRGGTGASSFRGVYRKREKWTASIRVGGRQVHLGSFSTEVEAAEAFDAAAIDAGLSAHGLNFGERKLSDA